MIQEREIRKRLGVVIDQLGLPLDRDRVARYTVERIMPEVVKIIREEVREVKSRGA